MVILEVGTHHIVVHSFHPTFLGAVIMGIGSLVFMVPHFTGEANPGITIDNKTSDNICRIVSVREQDMGLGRLSNSLSNPPLTSHNLR